MPEILEKRQKVNHFRAIPHEKRVPFQPGNVLRFLESMNLL